MKLIFDATMGEPLVEALRGLFRHHPMPKPNIVHVYDIFPRDVKDEDWVPQLMGDEWLVISGDGGKGRAPRLPALCAENERTHVILSPTVHTKVKQFGKIRAIVILWPQIQHSWNVCQPGSRFQIQATNNTYEHFRLVEKDV